jgi:hypothetical protein
LRAKKVTAVLAGRTERRHHFFGHPLELLEHHGLRRAQTGGQVDMLHAREASFQLLQVLDQLVRRAGEPGADP